MTILTHAEVPTCSPSRGGDVAVCVFLYKPTELFYSFLFFLLSVSVLTALSTVFYSTNSPDNSPLSQSVLLVLFLHFGPFNYISIYESFPQP